MKTSISDIFSGEKKSIDGAQVPQGVSHDDIRELLGFDSGHFKDAKYTPLSFSPLRAVEYQGNPSAGVIFLKTKSKSSEVASLEDRISEDDAVKTFMNSVYSDVGFPKSKKVDKLGPHINYRYCVNDDELQLDIVVASSAKLKVSNGKAVYEPEEKLFELSSVVESGDPYLEIFDLKVNGLDLDHNDVKVQIQALNYAKNLYKQIVMKSLEPRAALNLAFFNPEVLEPNEQ